MGLVAQGGPGVVRFGSNASGTLGLPTANRDTGAAAVNSSERAVLFEIFPVQTYCGQLELESARELSSARIMTTSSAISFCK